MLPWYHCAKKYGRAYGHIWRASRKANGKIVKCTTFHKKNPNQVYTDSDIEENVQSTSTNTMKTMEAKYLSGKTLDASVMLVLFFFLV